MVVLLSIGLNVCLEHLLPFLLMPQFIQINLFVTNFPAVVAGSSHSVSKLVKSLFNVLHYYKPLEVLGT